MDRRLQVFVSSTFTDLIAERQAAVGAILKAGHIPAGMELFTAGDQSQMDTIRRWIDESDVYMLILGGRYGSIEPISGLSYTELEYDYAASKNKPSFAVVLKPGAIDARVKVSGLGVAEMDNPALLKSFESKVLNNLSSFFEDEKDIKLCVFETLPAFHANRDLIGWVRGDQVIDSGPFREQNERLSNEVEQLRAALAAAEQKAAQLRGNGEEAFAEVLTTLESIPLVVPLDILPEGTVGPWKTNMLDFLTGNSARLMEGVSNRAGQSELSSFLFWQVANILALHGLMKNVKGQGAIRTYEVTPFGQKVMAALSAKYHREEMAREKRINQQVEAPVESNSAGSDAVPSPSAGKRKAPRKSSAKK